MNKLKKGKTEKGITLIALIITIIVLLILAIVTIGAIKNDGLIQYAQNARKDYTEAANQEQEDLNTLLGQIGDNVPGNNGEFDAVPASTIAQATEDNMFTKTVNSEIADVDGNKIVVPAGFKILVDSTTGYTEKDISVTKGVVIQDKDGNEFVWIPVENADSLRYEGFSPAYFHSSGEKIELEEQQDLNKYYGTKEDGITPFYDMSEFQDYTANTNVTNSIKTYSGFYVGRYETTIDGAKVGVQRGKTKLSGSSILKDGINENTNEPYYYRFYGLYKALKDMYANNQSVGSLMIDYNLLSTVWGFSEYASTISSEDIYKNIYGLLYDAEYVCDRYGVDLGDYGATLGGFYRYTYSYSGGDECIMSWNSDPFSGGGFARVVLYIK